MGDVTKLLKKAVAGISTELSAAELDRIAEHLIRLVDEDDAAWEAAPAKSPEKLRRLQQNPARPALHFKLISANNNI